MDDTDVRTTHLLACSLHNIPTAAVLYHRGESSFVSSLGFVEDSTYSGIRIHMSRSKLFG